MSYSLRSGGSGGGLEDGTAGATGNMLLDVQHHLGAAEEEQQPRLLTTPPTGRTRSEERPDPGMGGGSARLRGQSPPPPRQQPVAEEQPAAHRGDRLTELMEMLIQMQLTQARQQQQQLQQPAPVVSRQPERREMKAPRFDGTGDVEYFITQFQDVVMANNWPNDLALLHLRQNLHGLATDCGKSDRLQSAFAALRARFGITKGEARRKLLNLQKDPKTSLHEHATQVTDLVDLAYPELDAYNRAEMALDQFKSTLPSLQLQQYLLTVKPTTLDQAVKEGTEFLQLRKPLGAGATIRRIEPEDEEEEETKPSAIRPVQQKYEDGTQAILHAILQLTQALGQGIPSHTPAQPRREEEPVRDPPPPLKCWNCGGLGHAKNKCPSPPSQQTARPSQQSRQGNGPSPRQ